MNTSTWFCDGVVEAQVAHGVVRLTLGQLGPDGKPVPSGQLLIPMIQLPVFINAVFAVARQIEEKVKENQQQQKQKQDQSQIGEGAYEDGLDSNLRS